MNLKRFNVFKITANLTIRISDVKTSNVILILMLQRISNARAMLSLLTCYQHLNVTIILNCYMDVLTFQTLQ